jgi:hypothetical protein
LLCKYLHNKALVENQVKLIYQRVYAKLRNETFFSIEALNKAMAGRTKEHNQTRMQQKPYSRQEKFLAEEKGLLKPLPASGFELKYYARLRVGQNNCVYLGRDKHYYSVPYRYTGREVLVIYTRTLVTIYCDRQSIATHQRASGFGYSVQREHLCSTHKHYQERSPEYYIQRAGQCSQALEQLVKRIFEDIQPPEMLYKRCDGLLGLQRKTEPVFFENACRIALENNVLSYKFVQRLIENKALCLEGQEDEKQETTLPSHQNIRGREYYQ